MKVAISITTLVLALGAVQSWANGISCQSADKRLTYSYYSSNGGPAVRGPWVSLVLDGKKLIEISGVGPQDPLVLGSIEFVGQPQNPVTHDEGNNHLTVYEQEAKVSSGGSLLFDETVACTRTTYFGPPIP
jgi:hypothetical protein